MGIATKFLITSVLLAVGLYWLCSPIPDGYSLQSSWSLGKFNALVKVFNIVVYVNSFIGNETYLSMKRGSYRSREKAPPDPRDEYSDILIKEELFDNVPVIVCRPLNVQKNQPGFVFYHGGGWVLGSAEVNHSFVSRLCHQTKAVFVSVDYRLAPEHIFPAGFEDCVTATKYFMLHAEEYNVDPLRIAIGGDSAGGNLAAAIALKLRDENFRPKVKMQVLIYPVVQSIDYQLPSMMSHSNGPVLSRDRMAYFANLYLNGTADRHLSFLDNSFVSATVRKQLSATHLNVDKLPKKYLIGYTRPTAHSGDKRLWEEIKERMLDPYFNPLLADDLSRLPMSYVFTCEYDVLRDEGILYVNRLKEAGNDVTHFHADIGFHGVLSIGMNWPETVDMFDDISTYVVNNL